MTIQEKERLAKVEGSQADLIELVKKLDAKVDELQSSFDRLTGAQKALMWITGTLLTVSGLAIALYNTLKDK